MNFLTTRSPGVFILGFKQAKYMKGGKAMDFFKKTWVMVMAIIFIIIGVVILLLGGVTTGQIDNLVELIAGILGAIGLLIIAIRELLQKKDTAKK